jgi:hypothetical protein
LVVVENFVSNVVDSNLFYRVDFIETPKGFRTPTRNIKHQADLDNFLQSEGKIDF